MNRSEKRTSIVTVLTVFLIFTQAFYLLEQELKMQLGLNPFKKMLSESLIRSKNIYSIIPGKRNGVSLYNSSIKIINATIHFSLMSIMKGINKILYPCLVCIKFKVSSFFINELLVSSAFFYFTFFNNQYLIRLPDSA